MAVTRTPRERWIDEVVRLNMAVACDVARRYEGRGIATDDLRTAFQRYRSFFERLLAT